MGKQVLLFTGEGVFKALMWIQLREEGFAPIIRWSAEELLPYLGEAEALCIDFDERVLTSALALLAEAKRQRPDLPILSLAHDVDLGLIDKLCGSEWILKPVDAEAIVGWFKKVTGEQE